MTSTGGPSVTLLVATTGGHLAQLLDLSERIPPVGEPLWVTFDSVQSRSLLQGRSLVFIPHIHERDFFGVTRGLARAHAIYKNHDIRRVISTGSGIALSFLPYAAARGIEAHYIESASRVGAPSLTGRLLENCPRVHLYRQYPHAAQGRWKFAGSVFEVFTSTDALRPSIRRIVVTVGSGTHGFRRLIERVIEILPPDVTVLWQTGNSPLEGLPIEARPMVPADELQRAIREADVVVAHAGCGTALSALKSGKYPILVPRDPARRELVDTHQIELAQWLADQDLALHRSPDTLSFEDLRFACSRRIIQRETRPPLLLEH